MRRRDLIAVFGGAAVSTRSLPAYAGRLATPIIGYLSSKAAIGDDAQLRGFREGLRAAGFIEGRNVAISYGYARGDYARLSRLAADLVRRNVRAIFAVALPATLAAKAATSTIPIVFAVGVDPIAAGLVKSLGRPGGNLTGVTYLFGPLTEKRLELLHELVPDAAMTGFVFNPRNRNAAAIRAQAEAAAHTLGLGITLLAADTMDALESAFASARRRGIGALLIGDDPFFTVHQGQIVALASRYAIPTMYYVRDFAFDGGLIAYGANFADMAKRAGEYIGRILEGASPADLPVEQADRFELVVNLKTAKALGLTIPPLILARADEVIE